MYQYIHTRYHSMYWYELAFLKSFVQGVRPGFQMHWQAGAPALARQGPCGPAEPGLPPLRLAAAEAAAPGPGWAAKPTAREPDPGRAVGPGRGWTSRRSGRLAVTVRGRAPAGQADQLSASGMTESDSYSA